MEEPMKADVCQPCQGTGRRNGEPIIYDIGVPGACHPPPCPACGGTGKAKGTG